MVPAMLRNPSLTFTSLCHFRVQFLSLNFPTWRRSHCSLHFLSPSIHKYSIPNCAFRFSNKIMVGSPRLNPRVAFSAGKFEGQNKEILVQHLLVGEQNLELLLELQKRIAGGEDLSDLAVEFSICPSKEEGGMLGWVQKGQMVPKFEEAAFSAPLNKVVRCKTDFGWHLLQVLSEREGSLLQDIGPEEFHLKMEEQDFIDEAQLLDVREPDEVAQASLPGFKVLPLRQFGNWGPEITNEFDPNKDTYVLCHHGVRSLQVAKWLQSQGFKRVFNIAGGIHAYAVKADASVPTY
ncbi:rhodanese-like/PpiC domain-containing protein 12, chloroplastic isoform X1 [Amborella trichopoda]|nr:rhodanese-like/PpiC domain-containing protein 12, chloroplastic isoform X1 [Amborella trichopoda]XP_020523301.1 rhodanese-like/PpiC domain-containing protein 12, chloroplastic isoform X1 [Amborella trichopoda]XP_020523302.1 rhodanese-like/PpiC domain-containing protein 12, chloroplastic isoform X1 [Amborella trichopoda]|eukprot:XP_006845046.2 rhodanese-like/PpiC domain-containing protein 12, chloroplastic isoform X1 [Amborella trichopoda]